MTFFLGARQRQSLIWMGLLLFLLALLLLLGPVLTPFVVAAILAYVMNPGVDKMCALKIGPKPLPRTLAVTFMVLLLIALVLALFLIVFPVVEKEIPLLKEQLPIFLSQVSNFLLPKLHAWGINIELDANSIRQIISRQLASSSQAIASSVIASVKVGGGTLIGWLVNLVMIPMVLFYLLMDWHPMLRKFAGAIPRRWSGKTLAMIGEVDDLLAQYLRGQLLVMVVLALYYSLALSLAGFEVALPVGIITGILVFIPYLGFGMGLVLALIAGVLQFPGWHGVLLVAIIYGVGQVLESFYLTPRLVGQRIGMHPLAVIFALLAFGELFGFVGVLLALPLSAILMVALRHLRQAYLSSPFYNE